MSDRLTVTDLCCSTLADHALVRLWTRLHERHFVILVTFDPHRLQLSTRVGAGSELWMAVRTSFLPSVSQVERLITWLPWQQSVGGVYQAASGFSVCEVVEAED